ncbi:MAG: cell division protein FtsH, partial [Pseudomonadota bacterium]
PEHDPIHKATIIPRGRALGLVMSLPERDQYSVTKKKYTSKIAMAMGGKVAEELKFGEENVTSGAASDIQQVSKIARAMVTQFGFSDKLGHIDYADQNESYLGAYGGNLRISGDTQRVIEEEVRGLIDEGYETARRILTENEEGWERLAQGLLEYETLTGDEIQRVINGETIDRSEDGGSPPPSDAGKPRLSSVPKTGRSRGGEPEGGMEPQPN